MKYAIAPRGVGNWVGARAVEEGWDLVNGETFMVDSWRIDQVLAEDQMSLRQATPAEITKMAQEPVIAAQLLDEGIIPVQPLPYDPTKWYWVVAGNTTDVYSTNEVNDFVPAADPDFVAWKASGGIPTQIDTEFNLGVVLGAYYPLLRPIPPGVLDGYADRVAANVVTAEDFAITFDHENRIRELEGLPPLAVGRAKANFKRKIRRRPPPTVAELAAEMPDDEVEEGK